jgi:hypothetical protein
MFADDHGKQLPRRFEEFNAYRPTPGLSYSNWEMVSGGNLSNFTNPSQTILLREKEPRLSPDGKFVKAYAFVDGHTILLMPPTNDFPALEKQRGYLAQPATN